MLNGIFTVVLTGGIASGKTAVSDGFRHLGVPVVDTDVIARELVEPGKPALEQIAELFGHGILDDQGRLDRRQLRDIIFSNPEMKTRLEQLLHPLIANQARQQVEQVRQPYCVLVIPLFAESKSYGWVDRVLVVDTTEEEQIARVMRRDQINRQQAEAILNSQASRQQRLDLADDVIENNGSLSELELEIDRLHRKYSSLAA